MLVFAGAVDKDRLSIQVKTIIAVFAQYGPRNASDSEWRPHFIRSFAIPLYHRRKVVEIRIVKAPSVCVGYRRLLADCTCLSWCKHQLFGKTEHLFTRGECELIHEFYSLRICSVVLNLSLYENRVASGIAPDMHAKGFDTDSIGFNK